MKREGKERGERERAGKREGKERVGEREGKERGKRERMGKERARKEGGYGRVNSWPSGADAWRGVNGRHRGHRGRAGERIC